MPAPKRATIYLDALLHHALRPKAAENDPRPARAEKLSGEDKYRLRQGNYRILYEIIDDALTVTVVKIGHRREGYRH